MTPTREEILAMAKAAGFNETQWKANFREVGPYDITEPRYAYEKAINLAYAAGQRDMQERAAKECLKDNGMIYTADRAGIIGAACAECAAAIRKLEVEK